MGWNDFVYGHGCGNYESESAGSRKDNGCDGRDLLEGVSKNDFIKVFLKCSDPVKGFFAGTSGNVLTLFDFKRRCVTSVDICLDDVVAVKTFSNIIDPSCLEDDHKHKDCC
ncbi:MAG: hypothetical protein LKI94_12520 [Sporolactobacillus sp.]|jgi:hypothetical protein|nr:hypothetical protein [Sporolactobacillus sp.]